MKQDSNPRPLNSEAFDTNLLSPVFLADAREGMPERVRKHRPHSAPARQESQGGPNLDPRSPATGEKKARGLDLINKFLHYVD